MIATTIMAVVVLIWCGVTPGHRRAAQLRVVEARPAKPRTEKKGERRNSPQAEFGDGRAPRIRLDSLASFFGRSKVVKELHQPPDQVNWFSLIGILGLFLAFGHSVLAMSGEETLCAGLPRGGIAPSCLISKRPPFIVFIYSLVLTAGNQLPGRDDHSRRRSNFGIQG